MILKIFKNKQKKIQKGKPKVNPDFFWKIIFYFGFVLTVLAFMFGFWVFKNVNHNLELPNIEEVGPSKSIKKDRIDKVLKVFDDREIESSSIINTPNYIIDPSL